MLAMTLTGGCGQDANSNGDWEGHTFVGGGVSNQLIGAPWRRPQAVSDKHRYGASAMIPMHGRKNPKLLSKVMQEMAV